MMDSALQQAVFWHGISMLPRLRELKSKSFDPLAFEVWYNNRTEQQQAGQMENLVFDYGPQSRELTMLKWVAMEASALSTVNVLFLPPDVGTAKFIVESWDREAKLSGAQVIALMVFGLYVMCNEDCDLCSSLAESWGLQMVKFLSPRPTPTEE